MVADRPPTPSVAGTPAAPGNGNGKPGSGPPNGPAAEATAPLSAGGSSAASGPSAAASGAAAALAKRAAAPAGAGRPSGEGAPPVGQPGAAGAASRAGSQRGLLTQWFMYRTSSMDERTTGKSVKVLANGKHFQPYHVPTGHAPGAGKGKGKDAGKGHPPAAGAEAEAPPLLGAALRPPACGSSEAARQWSRGRAA